MQVVGTKGSKEPSHRAAHRLPSGSWIWGSPHAPLYGFRADVAINRGMEGMETIKMPLAGSELHPTPPSWPNFPMAVGPVAPGGPRSKRDGGTVTWLIAG